ncbi:MAG: hypothetical protein ACI84B_000967 [Oceanospirillaceae bacterium]|jgi:hypothetical protein
MWVCTGRFTQDNEACPWGSSAPPWPFAGDATYCRSLNMNTQPHQIANLAPNPKIQIDTNLIGVGNAKVIEKVICTKSTHY